jgi:RNA polymerase sigma factor (sigma-70 family)
VGAGGVQQRLALRVPDPEDRVAGVMAAHGRTLLRTAHHWSLCHDDALDAYQRGLEIFLRRADAVEPATEVAWLKVVIKHEALAIRRSRQDSVGGEEPDLDAHAVPAQRGIDEQVEGGERVSRSAEALRALKPDEARALMLKAEGLSYAEIGERCGWTYTKVNRAITEGRRRFMEAYRAIESGNACERFAPVLAALAGGTASSAEIVEIRPHLRHCMTCRATMRELHIERRRRLRLLLPPFVWGPVGWLRRPAEPAELPSAEVILELPEGEHARRLPFGRLKDELLALFNRTNTSDVAAGIHIATAGGGGRISALAALIGFCVSGVGAGALCVATGVVQAPSWILHEEAKPRAEAPVRKRRAPARLEASVRAAESVATATPTPAPRARPKPRSTARPRSRSPRRDPSRGTTPSSHESAPISEAPPEAVAEFSMEQSGPSSDPSPDPAPATGGGEFTP